MAIALLRPRLEPMLVLVAGLLCLIHSTSARAAAMGLFGPESVSAVADFRLIAAEGEHSWTDGGFGKARFGGSDDGEWKLRPAAAEVSLVWQPRFSWTVSGTVVAAVQHGQDNPVDLVEAFVSVKPLPSGSTRLSGRAGLYWPQISLEHEGAAWTVADMITPSAINSWIGEEVKVIGAEASVAKDIGSARLSGTFGLFGFNDTSGTLLAFRGWALHDLKATGFGLQPLPPLNGFMLYAQAPETRPLIEIDTRPGYYARAAARIAAPIELSAFYYDNRGDPEAVTEQLQWGWDTRFLNLGARIDASERTRILAQAMTGITEMGIESDAGYWVETRFRSAFVRVSHDIASVTVSGRYERFDTRERGTRMAGEESEDGWAVTAAASWKLSDNIKILAEILHIDSKRGSRSRIGTDPHQKQTVVQAALRLKL